MKTCMYYYAALLLVIGSAFMLSSCEEKEVVVPFPPLDEPNGYIDALVFSIDESPFGKSHNEWIEEWLAIFPGVFSSQPVHNGSNLFAVPDETNNVYFMAGDEGGPAIRSIKLDSEKAILFPVLNTIQTFPCPFNAASVPSSEQSIGEFLKAETSRVLSMNTIVSITLDGLPYSQTADHMFTSDVFVIQNGEALSTCFDACIIPEIRQQAVWAGYWVMLRGLDKGEHILTIKGEIPNYDLKSDVTYHIDAR